MLTHSSLPARWTQQLEATKRALETKTITTDATGVQELGTPADDPVSIQVQKEQEAAQTISLEAQAEQQRRMDAGRANMRKWWVCNLSGLTRTYVGFPSEKRRTYDEIEKFEGLEVSTRCGDVDVLQ